MTDRAAYLLVIFFMAAIAGLVRTVAECHAASDAAIKSVTFDDVKLELKKGDPYDPSAADSQGQGARRQGDSHSRLHFAEFPANRHQAIRAGPRQHGVLLWPRRAAARLHFGGDGGGRRRPHLRCVRSAWKALFRSAKSKGPMASTWPSIDWMAKKSNSPLAGRSRVAAALAAVIAACWPGAVLACPFCTALVPTLCQLREQAAVTALVEVEEQSPELFTRMRLHKALTGSARLRGMTSLAGKMDLAAKAGSLLLIFGSPDGEPGASAEKDSEPSLAEFRWHAVAVNEREYGYLAKAPALKTPAVERLRYFAGFLEHPDPLIAQDAYLEFGHASFRDVSRAADALPLARMKDWLADERVPAARKGFYGMTLGLATDPATRRENAAFLEKMILAPEDDFRAGFDGILGGYLLLRGTAGLELIETRYLANLRAADGDVRHAIVALRFYREFGRDIPPERLSAALARVSGAAGVRGRGDHRPGALERLDVAAADRPALRRSGVCRSGDSPRDRRLPAGLSRAGSQDGIASPAQQRPDGRGRGGADLVAHLGPWRGRRVVEAFSKPPGTVPILRSPRSKMGLSPSPRWF